MKKSQLLPEEFSHFYGTYLAALDDVDLMEALSSGKDDFVKFVEALPENKWHHAYASDKWTLVEVLTHILDTERIFQYRAFRFSRNDKTELPGFDQDDYILEANAKTRSKKSILYEFRALRDSTIALFSELTEEKLVKTGTASGKPWSVAALGFVICGHQKYHCNIIRERYLRI